jgi:hypothetical protein
MTSIRYQVGGALPQDVSSYVTRDSDRQLLEALKAGEFCYVLNSRQMGKSSLMIRTLAQLKESGWKGIILDFSAKDTQSDQPDSWYFGIINELNKGFHLLEPKDCLKWFKERDIVSPVERLGEFIETVLLPGIIEPIVIFVDEIDSTLGLPFTDDFFALIRACYNRRAEKPDYKRLTFALLGVAAPSDLIKNKSVTPFNIGTPIDLNPFPTDLENDNSFKTMEPLLAGGIEDKKILQEILDWTGGQPFLTQKLCDLIVTECQNNSFTTVKEVVNRKIIKNWQTQDNPAHLKTIQNRLSENKSLTFDLLNLYEKILQSENQSLKADNNSQKQHRLKLSGLVLQEKGFLKPYNRIYQEIFNESWVETEKAKLRHYIEEFENWKKADLRQKERYLLYGAKGEQVQQWRDHFKAELYETEAKFLDRSQEFGDKIKEFFPDLLGNQGMIESIIQSANDLTGGLSEFNKIVFNIAKHNNFVDLQQDKVQGWLENLVLSNSSNLGLFEQYEPFRKDRDQFLNQEDARIDNFALISTFEQIAQKEPVPFNEKNPQHRKLKAMCFIILDKEHNLRIINKIYEKLLNQDWIKSVIEQIRPYTKPFQKWKDLGKSHDYVLQSNNLKLALKWLGKKPTPKLEVLEIEFVMTSLVAEVWATASPFVQSEAISLIITFRPSLQGKNNYSDFLLREILQWTKSQTPALEKLLEWVNESEIPVKNNREWLASLARSHIKSWNCQKLFDFSLALHSSQKEKDREVFVFFDEYLGMNNPQGVITEETRREYEKILDKYQKSQENDFQFQKLVLTFLKRKFARICLMSKQKPEQEKLDVLLDEIVIGSRRHLKSVLIFNLDNGLPLYHNKQLKSDDPDLYHALFADGGDAVGEAIEGFESLSKIQEALDNFGSVTTFGNLIYSIFKLEEGTMMVYFLKLTTSFAICFIAPDGINLGLVVTRSQSKIKNIENELKELGF